MSKANPFIASANAGEFSPRMDARVDFEKYASAISRGLNLICLPQGGITKRPGTRFIKEVKTSSAATWLIPFEPAVGQSYVIEAGNLYFRFYRNQGRVEVASVPVAVVTPYLTADLSTLRTAQAADVMYIFHDNYPPYKLERLSDTNWTLTKVDWKDGPWLEINPGTDLEAKNLHSAPRFDNALEGWAVSMAGTGVVQWDATNRMAVFTSNDTAAGSSAIDHVFSTSFSASVHVVHFNVLGSAAGGVGLTIGTSLGGNQISALTVYQPGWYSFAFTPGAGTFYFRFSNTKVLNQSVALSAVFIYTVDANLLQPSGMTGSITVTSLGSFAPFLATDVGRQLRFEYPGRMPVWGTITAFTDTQHVTVLLNGGLRTTAPLEAWRFGAWSDTTGWPHCGTFYQQRLFAGRTTHQPQTVWASQTADFENMRPDSWSAGAVAVQDDDALNFTIASTRVVPVTWMLGTRRLVIGSQGGQWVIESKGAALTPSDFGANPQTSVASLDIAPAHVDNLALFAERAKRAVYDLGYDVNSDSFVAADITILSDHITKGSVAQLAYQAQPFSNLWVRLENGKLACLTYKRSQNVVGWTPVEIAGSAAGAAVVEAVAVIRGDDDAGQVYSSINRDEVWLIVKRTIGGSTKRYIELLEGVFDGPNRAQYDSRADWRSDVKAAQVDAVYLDSALTYQGASASTISGLSHLEGETVAVYADGAQQENKTVASGSITLDQAATTVQVGLPYQWIYRGMKLPFGSPTGQGVGQRKAVSGLVFVLRDCGSFDYAIDLLGEGDEAPDGPEFIAVPFRTPADPMNEAVPLFSGEVEHNPDGGINSDPRIVMRATNALPWTLLGIMPRVAESEL